MSALELFFYLNAALMILTALMAMTKKNAVHALLYFILSVLSLGIAFYLLQAPLAAALEVMVYAGAIMVLFIFVVMLLNIFKQKENEPGFFKNYGLPLSLALLLMALFLGAMSAQEASTSLEATISVKDIAIKLFTDYGIFVELGSLILLAGLVGSFHLGKKIPDEQ